MALSNIATPKYYGWFRDQVLMGKTIVNKKVALQMERIDRRIMNPCFYYDDEATDRWIDFCESELTLTDGSDLHLMDSYKLWGEDLLSWYYFIRRSVYIKNQDGNGGHYITKKIKQRLTTKQYLILGRGGAKSLYGTCIQAYFLAADPSTTNQYTTSPTMAQSDEVVSPLKTALVRSKGPLFRFLTDGSMTNTTGSRANRPRLTPTKRGIENLLTNSILQIRPMTIDKLQGLRPKVATVDEWLSGDIREDVIGALEQGATKGNIMDYIIVAFSSEGTVRNGAGDDIKIELEKILKNEYQNDHVSVWWYQLDSIDEVGDPSMWVKANPNIGTSVTYEAYQLDVERAEKVPAARNDILAKRFGIPLEGFTYYFSYDEIQPHNPINFWSMPCAMGADLSQGNDFCAFSFLFPLKNGSFGLKVRSYITSNTLTKLPAAMRQKYQEFIDEGSLIILEGVVIDLDQVYDDLDDYISSNGYSVMCFGYDPYNAKEFVERWTRENGPFGVEKVIQGSRTESVPLGEIKKLTEERMLIFDQKLMSFAMGNAITIEDNNGNRKLQKRRYEEKIDNVASTMDAYVAYKHNKEAFE